jgi:type IV pilus assembly protein PilF
MKQLAPILLFAIGLLTACMGPATDVKQAGGDPHEAARVNTRLGIDYLRQGDTQSARTKLERAVALDPGYADAQSALALLYAQTGENDKADRHYQRALDLDPENALLLNNYGVFLCERKQIQRAEGYFRRAAENIRYATPEVAYTNAGVCVRRIPDLARAENYFRQALEKNPKFADALTQMALLNVDRGNYMGARAFLQRYEAVARPTRETLQLSIRTEMALGDRAAAERYSKQLQTDFGGSGGTAGSTDGGARLSSELHSTTQSPE